MGGVTAETFSGTCPVWPPAPGLKMPFFVIVQIYTSADSVPKSGERSEDKLCLFLLW